MSLIQSASYALSASTYLTKLQVVEQRLIRRGIMGLVRCQFISDQQLIPISKSLYFGL